MPVPLPFVHGRPLHGTAEALQEEIKEAPWESGPGLTVGGRREAQARQMGQMAAGGVAMQDLQQEELHGRDRRQHAVAPGGIPNLTAHGQNGFGLQQHGPLASEALQDRGDVWNHLVTSSTIGVLPPIHTGDVWRIPTTIRSHAIEHVCG
jgi:hypothetical protein